MTYTAFDSGGSGPLARATQSVSQTFTITVEPAPLMFREQAETMTAMVGVKFTSPALPEAKGGISPYSYTASGLPLGLSFSNATRQITGTPTNPGAFIVTYTAFDSGGSGPLARATQSVSQSFTITVEPAPLMFMEQAETMTAMVGVDFTSSTLPEAKGGISPYSYTASGLPTGLSFNNATRQISGTPVNPGTVTVTYTALDSGGQGPLARATQSVSQTFDHHGSAAEHRHRGRRLPSPRGTMRCSL